MAKVQKAANKAANKAVAGSTKKVNVAVTEDAQGGGIQISPAEIALATKIVSEIVGGSAGMNGPVPIVRKPEVFEFVKTQAKELFPDMTNRQVREVMELVIKAFLVFPQVGASVTIVKFGNFKVIRRDERNTSKFGVAKVVPATNYYIFEPGKIAKEAAASATNAIPHGNLRKKMGLKKEATVATETPEKIEL